MQQQSGNLVGRVELRQDLIGGVGQVLFQSFDQLDEGFDALALAYRVAVLNLKAVMTKLGHLALVGRQSVEVSNQIISLRGLRQGCAQQLKDKQPE